MWIFTITATVAAVLSLGLKPADDFDDRESSASISIVGGYEANISPTGHDSMKASSRSGALKSIKEDDSD